MKFPYLSRHVPIVIGAVILASCGSGSNPNTQPSSELSLSPVPETGQANEQMSGPDPLSLSFVEDASDQTEIVTYTLKLVLDEELVQSPNADEIKVSLSGAVWNVEELPSPCTVINNDQDSIDMLSGSISCLVAEDGREIELPIAHPPYKQQSIHATAWNSVSPSVTTETIINHSPSGETTLDPLSTISTEILRFLDVASGSVTNGMVGIAKSTTGCSVGGMVEEVPFGDGRFGGVEKIFSDCLSGDRMLNGTQSTGWGLQVFTETLDQFSLTIDGPPSISFSGNALHATYDTGEKETEINGSLVRIDSAGETISLSNYSSRCDGNGLPVQPTTSVQPPPGYTGPTLTNTIKTTFEAVDRLFDSEMVSVNVTAQLQDQGSMLVSSTMGSSLSILWVSGYFPAMHLSFIHNDETKTWIIPLTEEFGFNCF